jgi:hypothetical protein
MNLSIIDTPAVVLADNMKSFWSRQIKLHSHGRYSHAMWYRSNGKLLTQNGHLEEVELCRYLVPQYRLKFFSNETLYVGGRDKKIEAVLDEIAKKHSHYDWLGIVGHLFKVRKFQSSKSYYCSEMVWEPFVKVFGFKQIYPSPAELDYILPQIGWKVAAIYDPVLKKGVLL